MLGPATMLYSANLKAAIQIGSGALNIVSIRIVNMTDLIAYIQLFNLNSTPTLGTSVHMVIPIPVNGSHIEVKPEAGGNIISLFSSMNVGFGIGAATTVGGSTAVANGVTLAIEYVR